MYLLRALGRSVVTFFKDECFYLAASISFFSMLAMVPLSLLVITLFGYFIGENQNLYQFVLSRLISLFPSVTEGITAELKNIITFKGISLFMVCIYGFLSLQLFYSMEHALNIIFRIQRKRHFLLFFFWSIFIVTLLIVFLLLSFTVSTVAGLLHRYSISIMEVEIGSLAAILLRYFAPFILVLMTFTAIYVIIPRVKISWRNAFAGAVFVTIMWELAKYFFAYYVKNVIHLGTIYGSLTTFILLLLWIFYSSSIFLLGAEFVSSLEGRV
jgi:membrane protein